MPAVLVDWFTVEQHDVALARHRRVVPQPLAVRRVARQYLPLAPERHEYDLRVGRLDLRLAGEPEAILQESFRIRAGAQGLRTADHLNHAFVAAPGPAAGRSYDHRKLIRVVEQRPAGD